MAPDTAILQTLGENTYRRPNLEDHTLDDNGIENTCPLDNNKHYIDPQFCLGLLDNLPLEILCDVLVGIDLRSLTDFRRANKRAMQVVNSIPEYQLIVRNCPALIRGLLSTGLGSSFSCQSFIETLSGYKCATCGDFAGFIYIITCKRVCFLCFSEKPEYFPLQLSEAERKFGVHRGFFASLPKLRSIPGRYSPNENTCKTRCTLIDPASAHRLSMEHHGSAQAMEKRIVEVAQRSLEAYRQRVKVQSDHTVRRRPPTVGSKEGRILDPRRFMAVVRAPWVKRLTNAVEWGFHCAGCQKEYRSRPLHWRRKYCLETFEHHIAQCGAIENGIHRSKDRLEGVEQSFQP
jgi:hypothetical protein